MRISVALIALVVSPALVLAHANSARRPDVESRNNQVTSNREHKSSHKHHGHKHDGHKHDGHKHHGQQDEHHKHHHKHNKRGDVDTNPSTSDSRSLGPDGASRPTVDDNRSRDHDKHVHKHHGQQDEHHKHHGQHDEHHKHHGQQDEHHKHHKHNKRGDVDTNPSTSDSRSLGPDGASRPTVDDNRSRDHDKHVHKHHGQQDEHHKHHGQQDEHHKHHHKHGHKFSKVQKPVYRPTVRSP